MSLLTPNSNPEGLEFTAAARVETADRRTSTPAFHLDLSRSLRMHPFLAAGVTLLTFVLLLLYAFVTKPLYVAEAVVYEQPEPTRLLEPDLNATFDSGKYDSFLQEQMQSMQRPDTISAALLSLPRSTWAEYGSSEQQATEGVLAKLNVARVTTSYQVTLTLKGSNPKNVTRLINTIAATYLTLLDKQTLAENDRRAGLLARERQRVATELRIAQEEQSALAASLGTANPNGEIDPFETELAALREQFVEARSAHDAAAAQLAALSGPGQKGVAALAVAVDETMLGNTELGTLRSSVSERRAMLTGQMSGMTPENPLRQRNQEQLAGLDRSLQELTARLRAKAEHNVQEKLSTDLQRTGDVEARIAAQLAQRTAAATNSTPKLQRAAELSLDLKRLLLRQAEIDDASRSLELERSSPGVAHLSLPAQVPTTPERDLRRLLLTASLPLALFFGLTAAEVARVSDQRIYTAHDVENAGGFPPLVVLPARDEVSEATLDGGLLRMAGSVESAYRGKGVRTFLFTAISSQIDNHLLCRGLLEKLQQMGIDACKRTTSDLLLATPPVASSPSERSSQPKVREVAISPDVSQGFVHANLSWLQARYSLVLIEASTLSNSAEAEYVARCTDAVILVAQCAVTTQVELLQAVKLLRRLQVPAVGIVLQGMRGRYAGAGMRNVSGVLDVPELTREAALKDPALPLGNQGRSISSPANDEASHPQPVEIQAIEKPDARVEKSNTQPADGSSRAVISGGLTNVGSLLKGPVVEGGLSILAAGDKQPVSLSDTDELEGSSSSNWKTRSRHPSSSGVCRGPSFDIKSGLKSQWDPAPSVSPRAPALFHPHRNFSKQFKKTSRLALRRSPAAIRRLDRETDQVEPSAPTAGSGYFQEQRQDPCSDSGSEEINRSGTVEAQIETDPSCCALLSSTPDRSCLGQQELGWSDHDIKSENSNTFEERVSNSRSGQFASPTTNDARHEIPTLRPLEQAWRNDVSGSNRSFPPRADREELRARDEVGADAQSSSLCEKDCMLTRQWSLLSRFQQASGSSAASRFAEPTSISQS